MNFKWQHLRLKYMQKNKNKDDKNDFHLFVFCLCNLFIWIEMSSNWPAWNRMTKVWEWSLMSRNWIHSKKNKVIATMIGILLCKFYSNDLNIASPYVRFSSRIAYAWGSPSISKFSFKFRSWEIGFGSTVEFVEPNKLIQD